MIDFFVMQELERLKAENELLKEAVLKLIGVAILRDTPYEDLSVLYEKLKGLNAE